MPKDQKHIGVRLRAEMQRRSLTPAQIAEIFEVKTPSVYDWLNFGRIAKKHLPKLVNEFGHSVEWWITGQESLTTSHQGNIEGARFLNSREQCILDLFSSMPKGEQEAIIHFLEVRNKSTRQKARARMSGLKAVGTQACATSIKKSDGTVIDHLPQVDKRLSSKKVS